MGDEEGDFGVVEDVGGLVAFVARVNGNGDGADGGEAEPGIKEFGAVGKEDADAVAGVYAQGLEHAGGVGNLVLETAIGEGVACYFDESFVGVVGDGQVEEVAQGAFPGQLGGGGIHADDTCHSATAMF